MAKRNVIPSRYRTSPPRIIAAADEIRRSLNWLAGETLQEVERVATDRRQPVHVVLAAKQLLTAATAPVTSAEGGKAFDRVLDRLEGRPEQRVNVRHEGHLSRAVQISIETANIIAAAGAGVALPDTGAIPLLAGAEDDDDEAVDANATS